MDQESISYANTLLIEIYKNMDKRTLTHFLYSQKNEPFLSRICELHFNLWKKSHEQYNDDLYFELNNLSQIAYNIIIWNKNDVMNNNTLHYRYFNILTEHLIEHETEKITAKNGNTIFHYIEEYQSFFEKCFEDDTNKSLKYNIWKYSFPEEWRVTKNNLSSSNSNIANWILFFYFNWYVSNESSFDSDKFYNHLMHLNRHLFPEVDQEMWAYLLTYTLSSYASNPLDNLIDNPPTYGRNIFWGRGVKPESIDERLEILRNNTVDLLIIIPDMYERIIPKINSIIKDIGLLKNKFNNDKEKYYRIQYIEKIFFLIKEGIPDIKGK